MACLILCVPQLGGVSGHATATPAKTAGDTSIKIDTKINFESAAADVSGYIQQHYMLHHAGLYANSRSVRHPDFMWGNGVMFSSLLPAARSRPDVYAPLVDRFFLAMNAYWDAIAPVPGYEPAPTAGNGNDKYYDDNAWMVITFVEAFETTGDPRFLERARETLSFVLSGWDDQAGGGIWWHQRRKGDGKNTCANAPAAVGCLRVAAHLPAEQAAPLIRKAIEIVNWICSTLQDTDGLFFDHINVRTGQIDKVKLTYNTALMIRAFLGLHRATGEEKYLGLAVRSADASDWFVGESTGAYRDNVKWSHLMVEADLEMLRATSDARYVQRAINTAAHAYDAWQREKPDELIEHASIARMLWLIAEHGSPDGLTFWKKADSVWTSNN